MWGGLFGYFYLGTHPQSATPYPGGNLWVDRFSFRTARDLHDNNDWRVAVHGYLYNLAPPRQNVEPAQQAMIGRTRTPAGRRAGGQPTLIRQDSVVRVGACLVSSDGKFEQQRDHIVSSSFEDYQQNKCWICMGANEGVPTTQGNEWHLWVGCGHMFCATCSSEMTRRGMPCPLCRRATSTIKKGPKYEGYAAPALVERRA